MTDALGPAAAPRGIIAALHLPQFRSMKGRSVAFLEDYVAANARVFADAGVPAVMLQDQTREPAAAAPATVALMGMLGRVLRQACPALSLGIILGAHDAEAALAVAHACGAQYVRLKVFVAAAMTAEGPKHGLGVAAIAARHALGRPDIAILADVFDRTSVPMVDATPAQAAQWAEQLGADGLILTGHTFADSLARITAARAAGVRRPVLIGGGVTEDNVDQALDRADGAIVSTSLMRDASDGSGLVRWDADRTRRLMDRVRVRSGAVA